MKQYINGFAYITLTLAFIIGFVKSNKDQQLNKMQLITDNGLSLIKTSDDVYKALSGEKTFGYMAISESQGYGGPLSMAVLSDTKGNIVGTQLVKNIETMSFLARLKNKRYYDQYVNKKVNDKFDLSKDIEAVSGATVSSLAIANAVRNASYNIAEDELDIATPDLNRQWKVSKEEGIILLIFILGSISILFKKKKLRYASLFLGFIFLGFVFNASLSLTHFGRIILGYFPDIYSHLTWWILMAGTFSIIVISGKNVYCSSVCPFHASQILLNKISGINLKIPTHISKILSQTPLFLLWLSLIIIFISANPTIASYEPFAMLFALEGTGVQWYILPASLIGSLFFSNFFCRFFCPVGGALGWLVKKRNQVKKLIISKN